MTRLFIRFYLGVLLILFLAWCIQAYVFRQRSEAANQRVVEDALAGGVLVARETLEAAAPAERLAVLDKLRGHFAYPIEIVRSEEVPGYTRQRFDSGVDVALFAGPGGGFVGTPLRDSGEVLRFGSLPTFVGPSQTELVLALGLILVVAATAIALTLRPVARQLRLVERTATAFAEGDLSARVEERKVKSATTLAQAFNKLAGRTETLLRTQRDLLQAVSHELRTPLSRINFAIDLIRDADSDEAREERLCSIERAAGELDDLVGELLGYVRLENAEPQLDLEEVPLLPLVEELIDKQKVLRPATEFVLGESLRRDSVKVLADRPSLERAIRNLIANAARFGKSRVVVDASLSQQRICVDVDDDGPGIPESDRARVFEPFVRLDESSRGAGLGLALVRRIVTNHGGTVEAEQSPFGGCRIRTIWPNHTGANENGAS